jgi:hypothetical protein
MLFSGSSTMGRISIVFLVLAALTASGQAMASEARGLGRSDSRASGQAPSVASSNRRNDSTERYSNQRIPEYQRRRPTRIIVVPSATYYYAPYYFVPGPAVVNASFFCIEHGVGFISRVGLLDHLGGTHKFPLEHAAAICPSDVDTCVFQSLWPLY